MIKVIREGKIDRQVLRFTCEKCGCIFEGEKGDYEENYFQTRYSIKCPCCREWVQIVKG